MPLSALDPKVKLDPGIAPVVTLLRGHGYDTSGSCEGGAHINGGKSCEHGSAAWVSIKIDVDEEVGTADLHALIELLRKHASEGVAVYVEHSLYEDAVNLRANGRWTPDNLVSFLRVKLYGAPPFLKES